MKEYISTPSVISAEEMNRLDYNILRGWKLPDDEDGTDTGFIIVDKSGIKNTERFEGYVSWLPTAGFNAKYKPLH